MEFLRRKFFKKPKSVLILNDYCLDEVFRKMNRCELSTICLIRNFRIRDVGQRAYFIQHGNTFKLSRDNDENVAVTKAFGHIITNIDVEFCLKNITHVANFKKYNNGCKVQNLTLRHIAHYGLNHEEEMQAIHHLKKFLSTIPELFPNLISLKLEYGLEFPYCTYFDAIPILPKVKKVEVVGRVFVGDLSLFSLRQKFQCGIICEVKLDGPNFMYDGKTLTAKH